MAILMRANTPLHGCAVLSIADAILEQDPTAEIDLLVNISRAGMNTFARACAQFGVFRNVWMLPFRSPVSLKTWLRRRPESVRQAALSGAASALRALGLAENLRFKLNLQAFCEGLLEASYEHLFLIDENDALYGLLSRKNRVVRHLVDDGFSTWSRLENPEPLSFEEVHLFATELVSERHKEILCRQIPLITPERKRLMSWLEKAFPADGRGVGANSCDCIFFDQSFGSGMYRSSHPSEKIQRYWSARKEVLKAVVGYAKSQGQPLVIRAHPYSSEREIGDLEQFLGCPIKRANGRPYEVDLLLGREALPAKIHTIASTAAFLVPAILKGMSKPMEVHL